MNDSPEYSRVDKYNKRRKNTKMIVILSSIGVVLLIVLLGNWIFGGDEETSNENTSNTPTESSSNKPKDTATKDANKDNEETIDEENDGTIELDEVEDTLEKVPLEEESTDPNVVEAYTANWKPIGTQQEGPHTPQYDETSVDWQEMVQAMELATGLSESNMVIHWLGRGGDQQAVGTISDSDKSEIYRVYLSWVDEQGWQPTKVEVLEKVIIRK